MLDLTTPAWRRATFSHSGIVYQLIDSTTGEVFKVGQTTSKFVKRFEQYVTARNRHNRAFALHIYEMPLFKRSAVEGEMRRSFGLRPALPWDNASRRLGRLGPGICKVTITNPRSMKGNVQVKLSHNRLYTVENNGQYFCTGTLMNGNQILFGVQTPELVLVEFDVNGNYIRTRSKRLSKKATEMLEDTDDMTDVLFDQTGSWQLQQGNVPSTIRVRPFFLPERWIGIRDLPEHYQQFLDDPDNYNEERRRELYNDVDEWNQSGDFVLYWDEEYYLDASGYVESS